jgi:hypothetical protein
LNKKKQSVYLYPLLAAVLLRLATIPFLSFAKNALMEYGTIARNMLAGYGYAYTWFHSDGSVVIRASAYMPPGQVFVDYIFLGVFGDTPAGIVALFLFQVVQACIFIYLTGKISDILFKSRKVTLITIWLAALYPPFIYVTMNFGVTSSALLLNVLILYIGIRFSEALRTRKAYLKYSVLLGLSCGLLLLFRGESPVIIASTFIFIIYRNRDTFRRAFGYLTVAGSIAIALLAPWTIRNYLAFDRFIPISSNGSFNFWRGNNAITTGSPWEETGGSVWATDEIWTELEPHLGRQEDFEKITSQIYMREATLWIKEHPWQCAMLSLKKAALLWTVDIRSTMAGTAAYIIIYACTLVSLLSGIFFIRRNKISGNNANAETGFQMMILWCAVMTLIAMIFFPLPRFQVLLIGIYFPIIGYGISETALMFTRRSTQSYLKYKNS